MHVSIKYLVNGLQYHILLESTVKIDASQLGAPSVFSLNNGLFPDLSCFYVTLFNNCLRNFFRLFVCLCLALSWTELQVVINSYFGRDLLEPRTNLRGVVNKC